MSLFLPGRLDLGHTQTSAEDAPDMESTGTAKPQAVLPWQQQPPCEKPQPGWKVGQGGGSKAGKKPSLIHQTSIRPGPAR